MGAQFRNTSLTEEAEESGSSTHPFFICCLPMLHLKWQSVIKGLNPDNTVYRFV